MPVDVVRGIARRSFAQPERIGEPAGRIDRDDDDASAGACRGQPEGGRRGGLADAARARR